MSHQADSSWDSTGGDDRPDEAVDTVEAYEDDGQVVLYDAANPLAWVEASLAVSLKELA
ncbi:DUF7331 family protein [Halorarum salinum]|uniref:Uncharacterized protein n=1 Tax=Halorarum salinum TaxID=2743089 RepID=A0A7D5QIN1_9EURY|nr:hypothetical protein [Halobaculum salinum]QLG63144.1 hypothetical protein HUG12_15950 [Halobaculum salinum]